MDSKDKMKDGINFAQQLLVGNKPVESNLNIIVMTILISKYY
jgi:hypothetical protein